MNIRGNIIRLYYKVRLFMAEMNKDQIPSFAAQAAFFLLLSVAFVSFSVKFPPKKYLQKINPNSQLNHLTFRNT